MMNAIALLVVLVSAPPQGGPVNALVNPGFEEEAEGSRGWELLVTPEGNGGAEVGAVHAEWDHGVFRSGKASIHLGAPPALLARNTVRQAVEPRPGATYAANAQVKSRDLQRAIIHTQAAGIALVFIDSFDRVILRKEKNANAPEVDWHPIGLSARAPAETRKVYFEVFSTKTGDLWADDCVLYVDGGQPIAKEAPLLSLDFDAGPSLEGLDRKDLDESAAGAPQKIAVVAGGARGSKGALQFAADEKNRRYQLLEARADAAEGDEIAVSASVSCEGLEKDAASGDCAVQLLFVDESGSEFGSPRSARPSTDRSDWQDLAIRTVAPKGTHGLILRIFCARPGRFLVDDLRLLRSGKRVAEESWKETKSKHLKLHAESRFRDAGVLPRVATRIEEEYTAVRKSLDLAAEPPVEIFLYADLAQLEARTGRKDPFVEEDKGIVHDLGDRLAAPIAALLLRSELGAAGNELLGIGLPRSLDAATATAALERARLLEGRSRMPALHEVARGVGNGEDDTLAVATAFAGHLLALHGADAVKKLRALADPRTDGRSVLGVDLDALYRDWRRSLKP